ncbi:hypothetical protein EJ03DRAFT_161383 [Teratosphaeria nubilosa]|uniref:Uncharacterized protein n=1 Tax=Teratosphaeria nubilosa TaxID=161662 RepID=A0A6G1L3C5_9PEZI|nr:hypothetical protein EJ03DRAFT_161383 [Teratosphaeria nubilosa]
MLSLAATFGSEKLRSLSGIRLLKQRPRHMQIDNALLWTVGESSCSPDVLRAPRAHDLPVAYLMDGFEGIMQRERVVHSSQAFEKGNPCTTLASRLFQDRLSLKRSGELCQTLASGPAEAEAACRSLFGGRNHDFRQESAGSTLGCCHAVVGLAALQFIHHARRVIGACSASHYCTSGPVGSAECAACRCSIVLVIIMCCACGWWSGDPAIPRMQSAFVPCGTAHESLILPDLAGRFEGFAATRVPCADDFPCDDDSSQNAASGVLADTSSNQAGKREGRAFIMGQ